MDWQLKRAADTPSEKLRSLRDLDLKDTTILKGLAITAIVFHNFFHIVSPVHQNEFTFDPARFWVFVQQVSNPATTIQALFAFFGHFGVQVFIFLSAYGLAKSHWEDENSWASFMWSRVKKFYPMFGMALLFWMLLVILTNPQPVQILRENALELGLMLAGISTIFPGQGLPVVGPWWFIPFILQFYAIWPLLRKLTKKFGWQGLVLLSIACFVLTYFANPILMAHWDINLNMSPLGRMRVLCLGIIAARFPIRFNRYWAIPAAAVVILGSEYRPVSYLTSLAVTVFSLWLYVALRPALRNIRVLEEIGVYSLAIFLLNGIVRVPFIYFAHSPFSQLASGVASALTTYLLAVLFHYILSLRRRGPKPAKAGAPDNPTKPPLPGEVLRVPLTEK
jgi:peptidoglycan/LPS O-acetylase OafA/YrhL